jgi:predicted nuclease of predicted toxin-antitoxin system
MKLLFDENLSPKLPNRLSDIFPNSLHVRDVGMKATIDPIVWDYAKDNNLMIVSKDADMHDLSLVFGNPPKVIWLRLGNCSTLQIENLLRRILTQSNYFMKMRIYRCLLYHNAPIALGPFPRFLQRSKTEWRSPRECIGVGRTVES